MKPIEEEEGIMPPNEEFVYNVKAIMDDGTEVALTELEDITLTEMEEILEVYDCVRVVRCEDCANADTEIYWCRKFSTWITAQDFCSYGKRRCGDEK